MKINIYGRRISNHLSFADDKVMIANDLGQAKMLEEVWLTTQIDDSKINYTKTKRMTNLVVNELIRVENTKFDIVDKYVFL